MNYIEEQEYINAIKQLRYYQAIKEKYEFMIQEERSIQEYNNLKRYANEVVYPAIEQAKKVKEDYLRTIEQDEKHKQGAKRVQALFEGVEL